MRCRLWPVLLCLLAVLLPRLAHAQVTTIDFEQFPGPDLFDNESPPLMAVGATISGGEVLSQTTFLPADSTNVYGTASFCNGCQPTITITFSQPVSNFSILVLNGLEEQVTYTVSDDQGDMVPVTLDTNGNGGAQVVSLPANNINQVTITSSDDTFWDFFIDNAMFTPGLSILDPDPTLLSGGGIVNDPNMLATKGTPVVGVAADGFTPLVIRIPAVMATDNLTITIINDQGQPSSSTQQDGALATIDGTPEPAGPLVVQVVPTQAGPMGFAVYVPPIDFDRAGKDDSAANRSISLQVIESSSATSQILRRENIANLRYRRQTALAATAGVTVMLVRPPVVLVHGIWGDKTDWNGFQALKTDPRFFVQIARFDLPLGSAATNSSPSYPLAVLQTARRNTLGFAFNAPNVMTEIRQFIMQYRTNNNVAVESADLVAHSMGGDIARTMENLAGFLNGSGIPLLHKVITIDTPHLGTPLAAQLLSSDNACIRNELAGVGNFAFSSVLVAGSVVSGAVNDLQGDGMGASGLRCLVGQSETPEFPHIGRVEV